MEAARSLIPVPVPADRSTIKNQWDLTATPAELAALDQMLATCGVPHQLGAVVTFEKPTCRPSEAPRLCPLPPVNHPGGQHRFCDEADVAGETRVRGSPGIRSCFPRAVVPSARDVDGVVCERSASIPALDGSNPPGFIHAGWRTDPYRLVQELQRQRHIAVLIASARRTVAASTGSQASSSR